GAEIRCIMHADRENDLLVRLAGMRWTSGETLEENGPDAVEIGPGVDVGRCLRLLGRHVEGGPQNRSPSREREWHGLVPRPLDLGDTEIDYFRKSGIGVRLDQKDVVRLEITVNDGCRVGLREAFEDLSDDVHRLRNRNALHTTKALPQIFTTK